MGHFRNLDQTHLFFIYYRAFAKLFVILSGNVYEPQIQFNQLLLISFIAQLIFIY